jgi:hypothetical protein
MVILGKGVRVSLGLMLLDIKPSTLGFTALGTPFHRDLYHWAPPALGDPSPQLPLHCFLWVIAVGKPPHPGSPQTRLSWVSTIHPHLEASHSRGNINNPYKPLRNSTQLQKASRYEWRGFLLVQGGGQKYF